MHGTLTIDIGEGERSYALIPLEDVPAESRPTSSSLIEATDEEEDEPEDIAEDRAAFEAFERERRESGGRRPVMYPLAFSRRLNAGEPRLTVLTEMRGMTQASLARATGLTPAFLSQLASGKRKGSLRTWRKIAAALDMPLDEVTGEG
jgi:DNA-binding XRE family transcriptional regulator